MGDVWIERLDAELDAVQGSPTSAEISDITNKFEATSGVAVAVRRAMEGGGGGSLPGDENWAEYNGGTVTVANTAGAYLPLSNLGDGFPLLDFSAPTLPVVVADGVYAVTANFRVDNLSADGWFEAALHLDKDDRDAIIKCTSPFGTAAREATQTAVKCSLSNTFWVPAGGQIVLHVDNWDGAASRDFTYEELIVQRLS